MTYRNDPEKRRQHQAQYYLEHKEKKNEQSRKYYQTNKTKRKKEFAQHRKDNPEYHRNRALVRKGWSQVMYDSVFAEQEGKCAICGASPEECRYGVFDADHKHVEPPKPRGLLCNLCNLGLGAFKDSPKSLEAAINYLRKYSEDATQRVEGSKGETSIY